MQSGSSDAFTAMTRQPQSSVRVFTWVCLSRFSSRGTAFQIAGERHGLASTIIRWSVSSHLKGISSPPSFLRHSTSMQFAIGIAVARLIDPWRFASEVRQAWGAKIELILAIQPQRDRPRFLSREETHNSSLFLQADSGLRSERVP